MTGRGGLAAPAPSGRDELQVERLGDGLVADLSAGYVEAHGEMRVGLHRRLGALAGELQHEGQGRVVKGDGRGARDHP